MGKLGKCCCGGSGTCCLQLSELPSTLTFLWGAGFGSSVTKSVTWSSFGDCTFTGTVKEVAIPGVTAFDECLIRADIIQEWWCQELEWGRDHSMVPASASSVPVNMVMVVRNNTYRKRVDQEYFHWYLSSMDLSITIRKAIMDCGDGPECQWVIKVKLVQNTKPSRATLNSTVTEHTQTRIATAVGDVTACGNPLGTRVNPLVTTPSPPPFPVVCSPPSSVISSAPTGVVTTRVSDLALPVVFEEGESDSCGVSFGEPDDMTITYVLPAVNCPTTPSYTCNTSGSWPTPPIYAGRRWFNTSTNRWHWEISGPPNYTYITDTDVISACTIGTSQTMPRFQSNPHPEFPYTLASNSGTTDMMYSCNEIFENLIVPRAPFAIQF